MCPLSVPEKEESWEIRRFLAAAGSYRLYTTFPAGAGCVPSPVLLVEAVSAIVLCPVSCSAVEDRHLAVPLFNAGYWSMSVSRTQ